MRQNFPELSRYLHHMQPLDFSTFPILETERLLLRKPDPSDVTDIFAFRSDPEVMKFIPRPIAKTEGDVLTLLDILENSLQENERINWVLVLKATNKVIGLFGFVRFLIEHSRAEVGYSLNRNFWRQGYTREALSAILQYSFETLELHTVEAIIHADNAGSAGVLSSLGFRKEAHFREDFCYDGKYRDSVHFGMLRQEWPEHFERLLLPR